MGRDDRFVTPTTKKQNKKTIKQLHKNVNTSVQ